MNVGTFLITDPQGNILSPASQGMLDLAATGVNEVVQNIRVIANTRIGSVMLDRQFGLDFTFLDAPQNQAQLLMTAQLCAGLTHFEPRATFDKVQFDINKATYAMDVMMSVTINRNELTAPSNR